MKGRMKKMFLFILLPVAIVASFLCFYLFHKGLHVVRKAPINVQFENDSRLSSTCYYVKGDILIVVEQLNDKGNKLHKKLEAYLVDIENRKIGIPSFTIERYYPLGYVAFIDYLVLEGVPVIGELEAMFSEDNNIINVKMVGPSNEAQEIEPSSFHFYKQLMLYNCEFEMSENN